ncbi:MAG: amino acid ABC transporter substrate-binding protein [Myxococcales bacterium FL481]|nr:MAG: amino acid ABC transporter substrate-binding protein [Myxococcales bacterium FL481]
MSRSRVARPRALTRGLKIVGGLAFAASCRPVDGPRQRAPLPVSQVDREYRDDWRAVVRAQQADPAGAEVVAAANRLLARNPPAPLRAAALLAKAQRAYLVDADDRAIRWSAEGLAAAGEAELDAGVESGLWRTSISALARGGDPSLALETIERARAQTDVATVELRGAAAIALERQGDPSQAAVGFAAWRELVDDGTAEAAYAERRFAALAAAVEPRQLRALANAAQSPAVATCLRVAAGDGLPAVRGDWTASCRRLPTRVGVLLPRTGSFAGLADRQLAAATAGVAVLARERGVELIWEDAGSTPRSVTAGAQRLLGRGAEVVVGPVGRANVRAAVEVLDPVPAIFPGESVGGGIGVAPALEMRVDVLRELASRRRGLTLVLAPDNGYGQRAAARFAAGGGAVVRTYPPATTSFKPVLESDLARAQRGGCVVILDAMPRVELIVRQLRSLGVTLGDGPAQLLVLSSAEGLSSDELAHGRDLFDGLVLAPAAAPGPASTPFENEYYRQQGRAPDDQALLVWRALRRAWYGELMTSAAAPELVRVRGTELVPIQTSNEAR